MKGISGKILRTVGILLFSLVALINLLGGIGTTCAAFLTEQYPNYMALIERGWQWLYQALVITTVMTGLAGIWIMMELIRGKRNAFRNALVLLVIGTCLAGIQFYSSQQLFGKAAPANMKFYINLLTLIVFLILLIPGVRALVDFSKSGSGTGTDYTAGLAAIILGITLLATQLWAGPSHTFQGENWVDLLGTELNLGGIVLILSGLIFLVRGSTRGEASPQKLEQPLEM